MFASSQVFIRVLQAYSICPTTSFILIFAPYLKVHSASTELSVHSSVPHLKVEQATAPDTCIQRGIDPYPFGFYRLSKTSKCTVHSHLFGFNRLSVADQVHSSVPYLEVGEDAAPVFALGEVLHEDLLIDHPVEDTLHLALAELLARAMQGQLVVPLLLHLHQRKRNQRNAEREHRNGM
jgi:hypothetical protein